MFLPVGFGHRCEVSMKMGESLLGNFEVTNLWYCVASDLGSLAVGASPGPTGGVGAYGGTDELVD